MAAERSPNDSPPPEESAARLIIASEAQVLSAVPAITPATNPRSRGGQPGHPGHGRTLAPNLSWQEIMYELPTANRCCASCGQAYAETTLTEDSEEIDIQAQVYVRPYRRKPKVPFTAASNAWPITCCRCTKHF